MSTLTLVNFAHFFHLPPIDIFDLILKDYFMSVDQLTVQQLKIFMAVYKHKSASLAAAELGVTNSAVSRALAAVRAVFDDVLFVRTASGFVPTDKARELASPTSDIVAILRRIDTRYTRFVPETSTGSIEIRAYDEFNYAVQRVIQERIQPLAPRIHFRISSLYCDCVNELLNGTVDFAVVYEGFNDERLNFECFSQTGDIFLLCRNGHPLLSGDFKAGDLSCYPLVEIDNYRDNSSPLLVDICHEVGSNMCVRAYTESVASAFQLIASSDAVAVICNQFTLNFANEVRGLDYIKLPPPILSRIRKLRSAVKPIGNYVAYGNTNQSPVFQWVLRKLVEGLACDWQKALEINQKEIHPKT